MTRPASYCGVAGFVAPVGSLDTTGFAGLSHTLDAVGLLTPTVEDLQLAYNSLTGSKSVNEIDPSAAQLILWSGTELDEISLDMQTAVAASARCTGADLVETDWFSLTPALVNAHATIIAYEACRALVDEARYPDRLSKPLNDLIEQGRRITTTMYRNAVEFRMQTRKEILTLLTDVDAIIGPAATGAAPEGLSATGSPILSRPWQLLGLPALTVPGHKDGKGLPLGVQLIAHPDKLAKLFALGHAMETSNRHEYHHG